MAVTSGAKVHVIGNRATAVLENVVAVAFLDLATAKDFFGFK